jgi:hypothetical protein
MAKRRSIPLDKLDYEGYRKSKGRAAPGEIREAKTPPPERDRLDRALVKSATAERTAHDAAQEGKPRPGEVLYAESHEEEVRYQEEKDRKFLNLARDRFHLAAEAESIARKDGLDDLEFRVGNQWPYDIQNARTIDGRPCLTMNRLPAIIRQVTNEQRQSRPSIQVNPVGDGADKDTAEIIQGIIRHIEVISDAEIAYDTAFEHMVTIGFGFFRVLTEYISDASDDQEILIKRIKNPFSVYFDPAATEPDYSDARYCFVIEDVPRSEFKQLYPNSDAASLSDFSSEGDNAAEWSTKETIRVAEYFHVQEDTRIMLRLRDGTLKDEGEFAEGDEVLNKRPHQKRTVTWTKMNAAEILEEQELPGKYIPIIPVLGDDLDVNGRRHLAGMVRAAKDPQRMYNYWVSAGTEMIALAPKAPFVGAEGQFEGHEKEWESANTRNLAKLEYKPTTVAGQPAPPPQRQTFEPPVQSINLMTKQADLDIKATTGIYDPSLGQTRTEQSGKAIDLLQKKSDVSNLNWTDNLARSIRHTGRVLLDWIPRYYDAPRIQRIINPDGSSAHVVVHNAQPEAAQMMLSETIKKVYDIGTGRYDVTISVGPSYQSKRQEAVASQMALVQAFPAAFPIIGDMLVANMDWPQATEMSKRLKKTLPPNLMDDPGDDPAAKLQMLQAQMQQLGQQHDILVQTVNKQHEIIQSKQVEAQGRMDVERLKIEAQITIAEIEAKAQDAMTRLKMTQDVWKQLHGSAHETAMQAHDHQHEIISQAAAQQHEQNLQDAGGTQ